ncbi:hypothetical protein FOPE_09075 [Fonsecaea pedrosoi]|nr:hypothetical protein FOPE_09075 [Fonsecaea pedrosoi]
MPHPIFGPATQPANHHAPRAPEIIGGQMWNYWNFPPAWQSYAAGGGPHLGYGSQPTFNHRGGLAMAGETLSMKHTQLQQDMISWARYYHEQIPWAEGWIAERCRERVEEDRSRAERRFWEDDQERLEREQYDRETLLRRCARDGDVLRDRYEEDRSRLAEIRRHVEEYYYGRGKGGQKTQRGKTSHQTQQQARPKQGQKGSAEHRCSKRKG